MKKKQLASLLMAGTMLFGLLPISTLAVDEPDQPGDGTTEEVVSINGETTEQDIKTLFGDDNVGVDMTNKIITLTGTDDEVTVDATVEFTGGEWTLDLNGHTLKGADGAKVDEPGTSGDENGASINGVTPLAVYGGNTVLTIKGDNGDEEKGRIQGGDAGDSIDPLPNRDTPLPVPIAGAGLIVGDTYDKNKQGAIVKIQNVDTIAGGDGAESAGLLVLDSTVTIDGDLTVTGGDGTESAGLAVDCSTVTIGGNLTATGGDGEISMGLAAVSSTVTVNGNLTTKASGSDISMGVVCRTVVIDDVTKDAIIDVKGTLSACADLVGLYIEGATVTAGDIEATGIMGIAIEEGTVYAKNSIKAIGDSFPPVTVMNGEEEYSGFDFDFTGGPGIGIYDGEVTAETIESTGGNGVDGGAGGPGIYIEETGTGKVRAESIKATPGDTTEDSDGDSAVIFADENDDIEGIKEPYDVTVTDGKITIGKDEVNKAMTATLSADNRSGERFVQWNVSGGVELDNIYSATTAVKKLTGTVEVAAEFRSTSSGGGGSSPTYKPDVPQPEHGDVIVTPTSPRRNDKVRITLKPDQGYELGQIDVTDKDGQAVALTEDKDGTFTFTQPTGKVRIVVTFQAVNPFADVSQADYYYDAVLWAVEKGVTNGTTQTTFSPNVTVTRAQMVTFLWRAAGSPAATGEGSFADVADDAYYYDAVQWAVEKGITTGTGDNAFSPDAPVTRAQAVTFQWRAAGSQTASGQSFTDVAADAWYADAVAWAVADQITTGTGDGLFSPDAPVTRAQAVTFLYRDMA